MEPCLSSIMSVKVIAGLEPQSFKWEPPSAAIKTPDKDCNNLSAQGSHNDTHNCTPYKLVLWHFIGEFGKINICLIWTFCSRFSFLGAVQTCGENCYVLSESHSAWWIVYNSFVMFYQRDNSDTVKSTYKHNSISVWKFTQITSSLHWSLHGTPLAVQ